MLRAMLRDLRAHKGRVGMTLVAIVLGVAFVVATWVVSDSTAESLSGGGTRDDVAVAVRGPERGPVLTDADVDRVGALPGVDRVTAVLAGRAALVGSDGKLGPGRTDRAGTGWDDTGRFVLVAGRAPGAGEVALAERDAVRAGLSVGDTARTVLADGRDERSRVVGVYDYRTLGVESAPAVAFDAASAPALLGSRYERIELTGSVTAAAVRQVMPAKELWVDTGAALADEARAAALDAAQSTRESLLAFAAVALLVGMFVIANTFTMLVTQRVRQFALLRAVGASRRQVRRAVLGEAVALGLVGATLGTALGVGLGLLAIVGFVPDGERIAFAMSPLALVAGFGVGIGVTVIAAYGSARRAAAVAPIAALRTDAMVVPRRNTVVRTTAGLVLVAAGVVGVAATAGTSLSTGERVLGMGAGIVAWIGVLLLAPALAGRVLGPVARLVTRRGGPVARIATRNAVRDPRRTAATSSALLVGLALVCAFATLGETIVATIGTTVRATVPDGTTIVRSAAGREPVGADVLDTVAATPGVTAVAADRYGFVAVTHDGGESRTTVSAIEPAAFDGVLTPALTEGTADLRRGVVVGSNEAAMLGVGVGDEIALEFEGAAPVRQRIVGVYETMEGRPLFYLDVAKAPAWFRDQVTTVYATGDARAALDAAFRDRPDVEVTDREGVIAAEAEQFALFLAVMYMMFGAAIVIAVFGVVNTLVLSVTERTRELGVLRAVGASRRLVRRAIRLESVVICGYGGVLGIVVGVLFGAVMQHLMLGRPLTDVAVPYQVIGIAMAGMVAVGVLAAAWPARRAARTDVLAAIASE
jgi:putative ABC transport system permease protein